MGKKSILTVVFVLLLFYPLYGIFQLEQVMTAASSTAAADKELLDFQRSIWISWLVFVGMAVYYKWTRKRNLIFYFTYAFLFVAFVIFGIYVQKMVNTFEIPSTFEDSYTLGIFSAFQNIIVSGVLTGFLHAGVWWFTRKWHRR